MPSTLCPAGHDHAALKSDPVAFAKLEQIGTMPTYDEPGQPDTLVMANCACSSTICREVFSTAAEIQRSAP